MTTTAQNKNSRRSMSVCKIGDSCDPNIKASSLGLAYLALRLLDLALFLQQEHRGSTDLRRLYVKVEHFNLLHFSFISCFFRNSFLSNTPGKFSCQGLGSYVTGRCTIIISQREATLEKIVTVRGLKKRLRPHDKVMYIEVPIVSVDV